MAEKGKETGLAVTQDGTLDLSTYDPKKVNILSPVLRFASDAPWLRYRAVEIRLSADHEHGDCYPAPGTRWIGDGDNRKPAVVAPNKTALLKIASAMGMQISPERTGRIPPDACARCIEMAKAHGKAVQCGTCPARYDTAYRIVAAVRADTGWRTLSATYEWSLDSQERKIRREAKKRQMKYEEKLAKVASGEWKRAPYPFDEQEYVQERLDHVIAERFGLAETKAMLRLIRALAGVRHTYRREEMERPFVAVRVDLVPDLADPAVRDAIQRRARQSASALFPGAADDPIDAAFKETPDFERPEDVSQGQEGPTEEGNGASEDEGAGEHEHTGPLPTGVPASAQPAGTPDGEPAKCIGCEEIISAARLAFIVSDQGAAILEKYVEMYGGTLLCYKCQAAGEKAIKEAAEAAQ